MKNKIPQYHTSYTEEENEMLHQHMQTANDSELVALIFEILKLYPEFNREKVTASLMHFINEIRDRDVMKQKYDLLLQCKKEWNHYCASLYRHVDVLAIRALHKKYKEEKKSCGETNFADYLSKRNVLKYSSDADTEFIRVSTFDKNSTNGIPDPVQPTTAYTSLDSVVVSELTSAEYLEKLGTDSLKSLLITLLNYIEDTESPADIIIQFLTRRYSYICHKSKAPIFASTLPDCKTLYQRCNELLEDIQASTKEAKTIE